MENYKKIALEINDNLTKKDWKQYGAKNCYYTDIINGYRLIKSCETIVAIVDLHEWVFVEFGKWSATTSKQCTQFFRQYHSALERKNLMLGLPEEWQKIA